MQAYDALVNFFNSSFDAIPTSGGASSDDSGEEEEEEEDQDTECQERGLADWFRNMFGDNNDEWGGLFSQNTDGSIGIYRNTFLTDGSPYNVDIPIGPNDYGTITGVIHNHPSQNGETIDRINRYPSGDDWAGADAMVANGTNPDTLTLYIVAPDGSLRGFDYSDRADYVNLTESQMRRGNNLPTEIEENAVADNCVQS